ncbi:MAG: shikimate kinase, partial [Giesbergeria sp.]
MTPSAQPPTASPAPLRCALVGMPGAGKSTVGRQLAQRMGVPFVDLDHHLEKQLGCSIRQFFEAEGEERFRAL